MSSFSVQTDRNAFGEKGFAVRVWSLFLWCFGLWFPKAPSLLLYTTILLVDAMGGCKRKREESDWVVTFSVALSVKMKRAKGTIWIGHVMYEGGWMGGRWVGGKNMLFSCGCSRMREERNHLVLLMLDSMEIEKEKIKKI